MNYPPIITTYDVERARLSRRNADVAPMILAKWLPNGGIMPSRRGHPDIFIGSPSGQITACSDLCATWDHETYRVTVATGAWEYRPPLANIITPNTASAGRAPDEGYDLITLAAHRFRLSIENANAYVRSFLG
jgi:hypothetical protein